LTHAQSGPVPATQTGIRKRHAKQRQSKWLQTLIYLEDSRPALMRCEEVPK